MGLLLAGLLLAVVGLALLLRRPGVALGVVFLGATVQLSITGGGGLDLKASELVYIVVALVLLPGCLVRHRDGHAARLTSPGPDGFIALAMLAAILLSYPVRVVQHEGFGNELLFSLLHFLRFALLIGALFLLQQRLPRGQEHRLVLWVAVAILVSATVALVTFHLGIWVSVDTLNSVRRARGTFVNGNQLAAFHVCALPFLLAGLVDARRRALRAACVLALIVSLLAVFQSESKMGILVVTMDVFLVPLFVLRGRQAAGVLVSAAAVFSVAFVGLGLGGRFLKIFGALASGGFFTTEEAARFFLWQAGLDAVREHWLFGTGFFTTRFFSTLNWNGKLFGTYHSFYLDFLSSNGIVPFLLLLVWLARPLLRGWRLARRRRSVPAGAASLVIVNVLVMISFENYLLNVATPLLLAAAMVWIRRLEASHAECSDSC